MEISAEPVSVPFCTSGLALLVPCASWIFNQALRKKWQLLEKSITELEDKSDH